MTTADLPALSADDGAVSPRADRPVRRVFTAEYKLAVLAEYDAAEPGEKGAILRRERLYSSLLARGGLAARGSAKSAWRGDLDGFATRRGWADDGTDMVPLK